RAPLPEKASGDRRLPDRSECEAWPILTVVSGKADRPRQPALYLAKRAARVSKATDATAPQPPGGSGEGPSVPMTTFGTSAMCPIATRVQDRRSAAVSQPLTSPPSQSGAMIQSPRRRYPAFRRPAAHSASSSIGLGGCLPSAEYTSSFLPQ